MKKNQGKKLQLNAEKVRELSAADAQAVAGGAPRAYSTACPSAVGGGGGTSISEGSLASVGSIYQG